MKILDFGLARLITSELTRSNAMVGTVNYMAPEQLRGERADHRADIFSFGVLLYELLGGRKPFQGDSAASTMYKILHETPQALDELDPAVGSPLTTIVDRAMAKAREDRYQRMTDLLRDLEAAYEPMRGADRRVISRVEAALRPPSGSRSTPPPVDFDPDNSPTISDETVPMGAPRTRTAHRRRAVAPGAPLATVPRRWLRPGGCAVGWQASLAWRPGAAGWLIAGRQRLRRRRSPAARESDAAVGAVSRRRLCHRRRAAAGAGRPGSRRPAHRPARVPRRAAHGAPDTGIALGGDRARGRVSLERTRADRRAGADGRRQGRRARGQRPRAGAADLCGGREGRSRGARGLSPAALRGGRRPHGSDRDALQERSGSGRRRSRGAGGPRAAAEEGRRRAEQAARQTRAPPPAPPSRRLRPSPSPRRAPAPVQPTAQEAVAATLRRYISALEQRDVSGAQGGVAGAEPVAAGGRRSGVRQRAIDRRRAGQSQNRCGGSTATVTAVRRYSLSTRDGQQLRSDTSTTLTLRQAASGWVIESVSHRPLR